MLNRIVDHIVIWVLCMIMVIVFGTSARFVVAGILSIIIVCLNQVFSIDDRLYEGIIIIYMTCALFFPAFMSYLPCLLYDVFVKKYKGAMGVAIFVYGYMLYLAAKGAVSVWMIPMAVGIVINLIFVCVSFALQRISSEYIRVHDMYRLYRDMETESKLLLENKNRELMAEQDYEIHVATLKERNRIAREIHDNVGHMLTRAILLTGAVSAIENEPVIKEKLDILGDTLNTAMNNIRESVHNLHDDSINLKKAVEEIIQAFPDFKTSFTYDISEEVQKEIKFAFIAIIKEGLNNAAKYSNGDKITIIIREQPGFFQLIIADNGRVDSKDYSGGIGIENMRERVRKLGGSFNINTDDGFRINVSVMK